MDNVFMAFKRAAMSLAKEQMAYTEIHRSYGIAQAEWEMLTQKEPWTVEQRIGVRSIVSEVVQISLTIAGLPATALPAQYVAAVIATVVAPANRIVCATRAPEAFDAVAASGLTQEFEVKPVKIETMISLVIAYSDDWKSEPLGQQLPKSVKQDEKS